MVFKTNGLLSHAIFSNCDVIKLYLETKTNFSMTHHMYLFIMIITLAIESFQI